MKPFLRLSRGFILCTARPIHNDARLMIQEGRAGEQESEGEQRPEEAGKQDDDRENRADDGGNESVRRARARRMLAGAGVAESVDSLRVCAGGYDDPSSHLAYCIPAVRAGLRQSIPFFLRTAYGHWLDRDGGD